MKKFFALWLLLLFALPAGCHTAQAPENAQTEGPMTNGYTTDYAGNIPVEIDETILQICYEYAKTVGYEIKEQENYTSVLLGESSIASVYTDDGTKAELIDKNDYLISFREIRVVIDADTNAVLGRIPYV